MTPTHRLGDKPPYHYQNNPNPRPGPYHRPAHSTNAQGHSTAHPPMTGSAQSSYVPGSKPRQSRYNPNVPGRPHSSSSGSLTKPRSGSRYNPDNKVPFQSSTGRGLNVTDSRRFSNTSQPPTPSSRYNAQQPSIASKPGHHNYYSYPYSRRRPSSVADEYDSGSYNGYPARTKWRETYSGQHAVDYDGYTPISTANSSKLPASSHTRFNGNSAPFPKRYSYNTNDRSYRDANNFYPTNNDLKVAENQHSLGSSLINSVPQTTRKIEAKVAIEHERIDLGRQKHANDQLKSHKKEEDSAPGETTEHSAASGSVSGQTDFTNDLDDEINNSDVHTRKGNQAEVDHDMDQTEPLAKNFANLVDSTSDTILQPKPDLKEDRSLSSSSVVEHKTHLQSQAKEVTMQGYSKPLKEMSSCLFPMLEAEMRLWELKNQHRNEIIKDQKYLLKRPITALHDYPFMSQNILIHEQAIKPVLLSSLRKIRGQEVLRKVQLKKKFLTLDHKWKNTCKNLEEISKEVKQEEINDNFNTKERVQSQKEIEIQNQQSRSGSRRRNRADFVDDNEIESVLLQIDPDYKHHQLAAHIPAMIIDPIQRFGKKFKDVNNLVTDKDSWAERIKTDGVDTFTFEEHEAFVEAYLTYPKKFGKISQYLGGLRRPEECVLHYYRTKKDTNYKQLLIDKNKKRKISVGRRRKEKEREADYPKVTSEFGEKENDIRTQINDSVSGEGDIKKALNETEDENVEQNKILKQEERKTNNFPTKPEPEEGEGQVSESSASQHRDGLDLSRPVEVVPEKVPVVANRERDPVAIKEFLEEEPTTPVASENANKRKIQELEEVTSELPDFQPIAPAGGIELRENVEGEESAESPQLEENEKFQQSKKKAKQNEGVHKSSYWSVKETNLFPELLKEFGTQWVLISEKLGTKSTTMVRNYFQRNAEQMGWQSLVEGPNAALQIEKKNESTGNLISADPHHEGIPSQQAPSVSIFNSSNRPSSTPMQIPTLTTMDTFSQQATPKGLPPPRLPSIQLNPSSTASDPRTAPVSKNVPSGHGDPDAGTSPSPRNIFHNHRTTAGGSRPSMKNILNDASSESIQQPASKVKGVELPPISTNDPPSTNVIVQELQPLNYTTPSSEFSSRASLPVSNSRGSGFLSAILNVAPSPDSQTPPGPPKVAISRFPEPSLDLHSAKPPILPPVTMHSRNAGFSGTAAPSHTLLSRPAEFNFANDPLAALAAVASAPEALESLVPTDGHENNSSSTK
ncbi:LADA_0H03642g1_1 [Lachancea dasiensis]|uniref:LADA_0H03642g1_1 n=1 Tax=Lachancea dasiensis TaxID=1072105 RepID=A0A1G4K0C6_9SACH|nr:LADA_0H03642g1_1 [Lachancea dasiensis]